MGPRPGSRLLSEERSIAGALDVGGHAAARVAQADESYGFHINYTLLCSVSSLATPARSYLYETGQL